MGAFAVIHPGLEGIVQAELSRLGIEGEVVPGGVRFDADHARVVDLARTMRTPSQLLLELGSGPAKSPDQLVGLVRKQPWKSLFHPLSKVKVVVSSRQSALRFRDAAAGTVTTAIREALKGPFNPDREARPRQVQVVQVRLDNDLATISVDAGGELLHRRGWRTEAGKAPLRENLAACLVWLSDWKPGQALLDPFCGSGTIPVEAALLGAGRSPFVGRTFACDEWRGGAGAPRAGSGARGPRPARREGKPKGSPGSSTGAFFGSDHYGPALDVAANNARRAGVNVSFRQVDVAVLTPPAPTGTLVCNPPYGDRLGTSVAGVYGTFGRALRENFTGWTACFIAPDPSLAQRVDRRAERLAHFKNGGIPVGVYAFVP